MHNRDRHEQFGPLPFRSHLMLTVHCESCNGIRNVGMRILQLLKFVIVSGGEFFVRFKLYLPYRN